MHLPGFLALILRRDSTQLPDLLSKAEDIYPRAIGARPSAPKKYGGRTAYQVPGGGTTLYGHCQLAKSYAQFDGWEINLLEFEELTHFTEKQYKYICARVRSSDPKLPTLIRATTNPGGEGHDWVFKHWGAWLDPKFEAEGLPKLSERPIGPPAKPGEIWWVLQVAEGNVNREVYYREDQTSKGKRTLSRTFIPAKLTDNVDLFANDPNYLEQLRSLDPLRRSQLLGGDWLAKPAAGLYFKRQWVTRVPLSDVPRDAKFCRGWDRAATEKTDDNDPDFTVGVLLARKDGILWVVDRKKGRWGPGPVESLIINTAREDATTWGSGVLVAVPQDPGQAGKDQKYRMLDKLAAYSLRMRPESGDKATRFAPFSSQAEHLTVRVVEAEWTEDYLSCLESFDGLGKIHDDDADGTSTAYSGVISKKLNTEESEGSVSAPRAERFV